jgi:putative ABC transport system permease protein
MIPFAYSHRNLRVRWKTTLMTASGFTLVVAALVVMLAFVNGLRAVCAVTGQPENVMVLSRGNADEVLSQLDRRTVSQIKDDPGISRDASGEQLVSTELFCAVNQRVDETNDTQSLQVRGIQSIALKVHSQVKLIEGRMFRPGQGELILGRAVQKNLNLAIGDPVSVGRKTWRVAGVFSAAGAVFESEIWTDLDELASLFRRDAAFSSVVLRTPSAATAQQVAARLSSSRQMAIDAQTEPEYYLKQSKQTEALRAAGITVAIFMGIGAVFGVTNTMFAAIGQRTGDIAVMRLLGFRKHEILMSFLLEALLIALIGGVLGSALGYSVNGLTVNSALSSKSVAFAFFVDGPSLAIGLLFTLVLGVLGGLLPALTAMRIDPLQSLR